jgi:hypothetical protein
MGRPVTWEKLGRIFDPAEHLISGRTLQSAQAPQALVLEDRVRVYFSTRETDHLGKYLSQVAFVDFDRAMDRIIGLSSGPVIGLGGLGSFDEHGIFPFNVLRDGDSVRAYTNGLSRRVSVSIETAVGLAISHDQGLTFERHGTGPIMAASLHEPFLIGDAFVRKLGDAYHMWYIFGTEWKRPSQTEPFDRVYKIAHAVSADGLDWHRDGRAIIADRIGTDECQAMPTVHELDGAYHMYFCYRAAHGFRVDSGRAYRIGYAHSDDLIHWERSDDRAGIEVADSGWDSQMQCYPHVFQVEDRVYMLYNGNEFGRAGFGLARLAG